jgi:hypothetical protein
LPLRFKSSNDFFARSCLILRKMSLHFSDNGIAVIFEDSKPKKCPKF